MPSKADIALVEKHRVCEIAYEDDIAEEDKGEVLPPESIAALYLLIEMRYLAVDLLELHPKMTDSRITSCASEPSINRIFQASKPSKNASLFDLQVTCGDPKVENQLDVTCQELGTFTYVVTGSITY